jgi:prolyl oligopeptidase
LPHPDARPTLSHPDDDPYLWLEDIDGDEARAWVAGQNAATLARLDGPELAADAAALRTILDRPDNIPHVSRRGGLLHNFWKDASHPSGLWRRTTAASYASDAPEWEVLLDLDALCAAEHEDWVWHGASTLAPGHLRAVLRLSRGGGDAVVLREFDLVSRQFVPDGFILPEAKGAASWVDADTLLLMTALGEGAATTAGYARTVRLWRRGADPLAAPVLFEVSPEQMSAWAEFDRATGRVAYGAQLGFYDSRVWLGTLDGPQQRLDVPEDATVSWHRGWLVVQPRTPWAVGGAIHAADTVLGIGLDAFLAGDRGVRVLFQPAPRRALQGFFWSGEHLVLSVLDTLRPEHIVITPGDQWRTRALEGLPRIGKVDVWSIDADEDESNGDLLAMTQTPIDPPTLAAVFTDGRAPVVLKRPPPAFDTGGAVVTQHEAISSDGERIPYVQVGPAGATGDAPVYMTGYGGFRIAMLPSYAVRAGKLWIEPGGTYVVAALRGGGEFGTWWHEAGRREGKIRSHDDFAAVAADLVRRGVTRPGRIAAEGGSNGGLLIANMLTRYPERFGALFCTIPLIDMRRYHRLLAGASWMAEYGDPDVAADWAFMQDFSAYHTAEPGRAYPPILIATTRKDDRVHPGHARKFAAKLQAMGYDALFHEPAAGGHGFGRDNAEVAAFGALGMAFLRRSIGWTPKGQRRPATSALPSPPRPRPATV